MMKRIVAIQLLIAVLVGACGISFAEEDFATYLWQKMAEVAGIDLTQCWQFMGMYTFGETTGYGYVTLNTDADGRKIAGSISCRIYPKTCKDITDRYYPMLSTLLAELGLYSETGSIAEWLTEQEKSSVAAYTNKVSLKARNRSFECFDILIQYDLKNNELYCLLTPTQDSTYLLMSKERQ